jgi:tetratricopeptide (TPR) repeat protein
MRVPDVDGGADFEVTMVDAIPVLVFRSQGVAEIAWADFHALDLEAMPAAHAPSRPAPEDAQGAPQNRWLNLKDALLVTNEEPLAQLLTGLHLESAGLDELRLVPGFDAFEIIGRIAASGRHAPFSIRLEIRTSPRNPRHLEIDLSNVRLFGFVDIAAPRVGVMLARCLAREIAAVSPAHVLARGGCVEVDLLEVALAQFLVARGWRLPRLRMTQLVALDWVANRLQLHFSSASLARAGHPTIREEAAAAALLPEAELTEESCRRRYVEVPSDRQAYLQWLSFRVAARTMDSMQMARDAVASDPTEMLPLLLAAIAASEVGAATEAAGYFVQAARIAEAAGEIHDAGLAHQAAARQLPGAVPEAEIASEGSSELTSVREQAAARPSDDDPEFASAVPADPVPTARQSAVSEALRLTSALHSLPPTAFEESLEIQERLATIHLQLGDWTTAEGYVQSVLRRDPARISVLEQRLVIAQQLRRHEDAAGVWARLARLYPSSGQRAQALFAEAEIRRELLGDDAGAHDAYLRSLDLDPTFVPVARQLLAWFWRAAAFAEVASIGEDLARAPAAMAELDVKERVRLAAAAVLAGFAATPVADAGALDSLPFRAEAARAVLLEVAVARLASPISDLLPVVNRLLTWERAAGNAVTASALAHELRERLELDLAEPGAARALGALYDAEKDLVRARVCYAFAVFLEPADGASVRLVELAAEREADPAVDDTAPRLAADAPLSSLEDALADDSMWQDRSAGVSAKLSDRERRAAWLRTPRIAALFEALTSSVAAVKSAMPAGPPAAP